jgi:hypothetical protein
MPGGIWRWIVWHNKSYTSVEQIRGYMTPRPRQDSPLDQFSPQLPQEQSRLPQRLSSLDDGRLFGVRFKMDAIAP